MTEPTPFRPLSATEARVLAVLVEKQHTVPDTYPMSLNALLSGCNQKTSRDPVMELSEADVRDALESLRARSLVIESSGGRVMRYEQNARRVLGVPSESIALLATLMLRGPQTAAELRARAERMHAFPSATAAEEILRGMAAHPEPLVVELPRRPGQKEARWAHLVSGAPEVAAAGRPLPPAGPSAIEARLLALEERLASVEAELAALKGSLGA